MSKLLIVAGKNSKNLRDFMTERGTFEVPFYYESLSKNSNEIKNSIIKVDKMLYLYQPDEISIRYDMGILKNLLILAIFTQLLQWEGSRLLQGSASIDIMNCDMKGALLLYE